MGRVLAMGEEQPQPRSHCCEAMTQHVNYACDQHPDPFECPDNLLYYSPRFSEYGLIIHDGGSSYFIIHYCPWCGSALPESTR